MRLTRTASLVATIGVFALTITGTVPVAASPNDPATRLDPAIVRHAEDGLSTVIFESGTYLTEPSKKPATQIALDFIREHREEFGLSARAAGTLVAADDVVTAHDGAHHLTLEQRVQGRRVHGATLVAVVDAEGRLVLVGGRSGDIRTSGSTVLAAGEAIAAAARAAGRSDAVPPAGSKTTEAGRHTYPNMYASGLSRPTPLSAELVWYLQADRSLRAAWSTEVELDGATWFASVVDAETGAVLEHASRYSHAAPQGTVYREQHPEAPGAIRQVTPFSGIDGSWVSGTTTSGNNVNAYRDRDNNNVSDYQPSNPAAHFDYTFTDAWRTTADTESITALDADQDAAITQLFYYVNDLHDWLYAHGFDEASGNFQVDNFGRGGTAGDPVLAESQDGYGFGCDDGDATPNESPDDRCRNNAFFGTGGDGTTARMQMYMWIPGRPFRDGSMDGDVVAHEYGHGVSNRLVPGTLSGATNQAGSLGEGWSDTISFLRWGDATVGEYVTGDTTGGIRTSNYDVHPDTYGDYSTAVGSPHRNGEIWAATTYDIRAMLGLNASTIRLILDGMRNTPNGPSPTFLDARDGILAADMTTNGGANQCALWTVFAGRGMGVNAVSNGLHAVPTEDFTVPAACLPTADAGGPYTTDEGTDVTVDGSGSVTGTDGSAGAIVSYEWDFDADGVYDDATGVSANFALVGQDGVYPIGLRVTDEFGNSDTDSSTVTVDNVAPTVAIDTITPIDEYGSVTVTGSITDPGWLDTLTATIDFGDGTGSHGLTGSLENVRPDATFDFSVTHQYGDDGVFVVSVTGYDDDTSDVDTENATVGNVDPTAEIDHSGEQTYDGVSAFVLEAGGDVTVPVSSIDPGSDDLTFTWDWDDGSFDVVTSLVNPPAIDPDPSPSVQPRNVTVDTTHVFGDACLYDLTVTVDDDDAGTASDTAVVIVTGNADLSRGSGYWYAQYRPSPPNAFTNAQLDCYLEIVNFFSLVFDGVDRPDAVDLLHSPAKSPAAVEFDEQALAAWLNFANGAIGLTTMVDTDGDGIDDTTFGAAMFTAETIRLTGTSAQIKAQKDIVERIVLRDEV